MLNEEEGRLAVKLARKTVETYVTKAKKIAPPKDLPEVFDEKRGVFVTLNTIRGDLRGCIGFPYPVLPLKEGIIEAAIGAAAQDPRFPPVRKEELERIKIEVTILTTPQKLNVKPTELPKKIVVGKHGLIVKKGFYQGLLLPQVAVEYHWTPEEFLSQTCMKAGLYPDAWLEEGTEISTFEGQIFKE